MEIIWKSWSFCGIYRYGNIWKSYGNHGVFVEFIDGNIWKSYGNHGVFVEFIASIEIAIHIYKP
jgi:hypothetical protein